jgi:hypothetical protein
MATEYTYPLIIQPYIHLEGMVAPSSISLIVRVKIRFRFKKALHRHANLFHEKRNKGQVRGPDKLTVPYVQP